MAYEDSFGYLPLQHSFSLTCGSITPLPSFQSAVESVETDANVDGYLYPYLVHRARSNDNGNTWEKIPKSERPALLRRLPATHRIELPDLPDDQETARYGLAGFIVHFLGFLYGRRFQFHDWWVDGRVALNRSSDHSEPREDDAAYSIDRGIATWSSWPERQRIVALNVLFLKSRAHVYELEWERFQAEYQIFDALYAIARKLKLVTKVAHRDRIPAMCQAFGIPTDQSRVDTIVRLRNDVIHEALWDGRMPGEARSPSSFSASLWLDGLSRRVTIALLGMNGEYVRSFWWSRSHFHLGIDGSPSWQRSKQLEDPKRLNP